MRVVNAARYVWIDQRPSGLLVPSLSVAAGLALIATPAALIAAMPTAIEYGLIAGLIA